MPFKFHKTDIDGVVLIEPRIFNDDRGFFIETYKKSDFAKEGINCEFIQDNHSKSTKGVLRGLHFQKDPCAQGKLVRCVKGKIYDVAVDIRNAGDIGKGGGGGSFGKWVGFELSEDNRNMLYIPPGFAHGFLTLSSEAEIVYKISGHEYSPECDAGLRWDDPDIGINWPLDEVRGEVILSEKDGKPPHLIELDS